ncbi:hypothetical protein H0266_06810 [Halobacillus locisalis]|uniref:Uncharacterized protein n=1 Tax=Halobacillus locisalis TaxID=220753 RepID=A0A838CS21_9BACI|nr:hypothetical protein [Halobacillus locisalis]MBA2174619.1 hypothetical protein [Halobacillus locisalis]
MAGFLFMTFIVGLIVTVSLKLKSWGIDGNYGEDHNGHSMPTDVDHRDVHGGDGDMGGDAGGM